MPDLANGIVAAALTLACAAAVWGWWRQRRFSRRIADQAAEHAEQRSLLSALYEKHPLATVVLEVPAEGAVRLISLNREAARLLGLDVATPSGPLDALGLSPELRDYLAAVEQRWRTTGQPAAWETTLPATQQVLETTLVPLGAGGPGSHRICVLSADVTKRRLMDQEVAQSRRLHALGELAGGIAHEFNNLLTPIVATTSLLQAERSTDAGLQSELRLINQAASRAAELTRRLLAFGRRAEEGAEPVRLADAVTNCFALLRATSDRRIEWESRVAKDLPPILFNPLDLAQIVFNLVINARDTLQAKLARPGIAAWSPVLRVSAVELPPAARPLRSPVADRTLAAWQRLTVEDNGLGIAPEAIERIFEPSIAAGESGKSAGLGLATVWHLITDAGGYVTVESKVGEGSKFHVTLPQWRTMAVRPPPAHPAPPPPSAAAAGLRILLVEDDPLVGRTAAAVLQRFGHAVTHLADGAAAWSALQGDPARFELLLLDVNMPRLSGVDLVRRVRQTAFAGRIVVMSGRVDDRDVQALNELRVDRILAKPFTPDELAAALRPENG